MQSSRIPLGVFFAALATLLGPFACSTTQSGNGSRDAGADASPFVGNPGVSDDAATPAPDASTGPESDAASGNDGASAGDATNGGGDGSSGSGGFGDTTSLTCGTKSCALPATQCCVLAADTPPPDFTYSCEDANAGCPQSPGGNQGAGLSCAGAENCPAGQVCCLGDDGGDISSNCTDNCDAQGGNQGTQMCDPLAPAASNGCTDATGPCGNTKIGTWGLPSTYATCGDVVHQ